jgi:hypothetical protein
MSPPRPSRAATLLLLGLAVPALAAEREVDGLVIGKTPCAEAIRTIHAQHRERIQAATEVPAEDSVEMNSLRHTFKKPAGDKTPYKVLRTEQSKLDEAYDLEVAAKGPDKRGLNTEECNPFGYVSSYTMVSKALNLEEPVQLDVAKLGAKKCPYVSDFISLTTSIPDVRLLCLDGVVALYSHRVPVPMPRLKQELAAKEGPPREVGIDSLGTDPYTMTAPRFHAGAWFRHEDGLIVIQGLGSPPGGPVKVKRKGDDFIHETPKELNFDPATYVFYLSKAAVDTLEQDKKLYDEFRAKAASRKKKRR